MNDGHDSAPKINPYDRYRLDPDSDIAELTKRFQAIIKAAPETERDAIRAAWEALTRHPADRAFYALRTHPESRPRVGRPPRPTRRRRGAFEASERDLTVLPSISEALEFPTPDLSDLEADPILNGSVPKRTRKK